MQSILLLAHIIICILIILLVLLQHGRGADVGAAFGSGASNTMFGSEGTLPFLVKFTSILAVLFYVCSLALGHVASSQSKLQHSNNALASLTVPAAPVAPPKSE
jgi:preprotein translocase subunit SecG